MEYKAVVADVDGTLTEPTVGPAPSVKKSLTDIVKVITGKGVLFSLATARSLGGVENLVAALNFNCPLILENGALIYDPVQKKYLSELFLQKKDAREVLGKLAKEKVRIILVNDGQRMEYPCYIRKWKVSKIVIMGIATGKSLDLYNKFIDNKNVKITRSVSGSAPPSESVHITHRDATKGEALKKLCGITKVRLPEVVGIGDSYNDLDFLKLCGLKVAMGNGVSEVREIADIVAPSYKDDGVERILKELFIKN